MYKKYILLLVISLLGSNSIFGFENFHGHKAAIEKLNYDSLFTSATPIKNSPAGQKLIERCILAYGGEIHLQQLKSFKIQYYMENILSDDKIEVDKFFTRDRQYKIIRYQQPSFECRILNGTESWFIGRDTTLIIYSGKYKAELFSYLTLSMPLGIKTEPFSEIKYGTRSNDSLSYLYMKKNDSLMIILGIDNKDNFIKYVEGVIYQDTTSFVFVNKLGNYRKVNGYFFPYTLVNISMGLEVAKSVVTDIEINPIFNENEFTPESVLKSIDKTH